MCRIHSLSDLCWVVRLCCVLLLATSCTKTVDYNYEYPGDQLAMVARISPQKGLEVSLYQSLPPRGQFRISDYAIVGATVKLFRRDSLLGVASMDQPGRYRLSSIAGMSAGDEFRLEVVHPDYAPLLSEVVRIPSAPRIDEFRSRFITDNGRQRAFLELSLIDPAGPNFYYAEAIPEVPVPRPLQISFFSPYNLDACQGYSNYGLLTGDVCFDRQKLAFELDVDYLRVGSQPENYMYKNFVLFIRSIDENYFRFLTENRKLEGITTIIEARPTYSNISGGFGIFLASNDWVKTISVP